MTGFCMKFNTGLKWVTEKRIKVKLGVIKFHWDCSLIVNFEPIPE